MTEVGILLRAERAARGLSQAEMAARVGVTRQHLMAIEAGADGIGAGPPLLRILADLGIVVLALPGPAAEDPLRALSLDPPVQ